MSLTVHKFYLLESPCYVMADFHYTLSPNTHPCSTLPPFILRPVLVTSSESYNSLTFIDHINGIMVDDPHLKLGVPSLPDRILNPHTPSTAQAFVLFNTTPRILIPSYPLPLYNLINYQNPSLTGALYHITLTDDKAPILLDQSGLNDPTNFFFYIQQTVMTHAY